MITEENKKEEAIENCDIPNENEDQSSPEVEDDKGSNSEEFNAGAEPEPKEEESEEKEEQDSKNYIRLMADFQNYKKRVEKEKSNIYAYANENIVSQLIGILDNFERALEHQTEDKGYADGMELIFKQLKGVLEKSGLEEIDAKGEDFDPNFHNAVMMEDNPDFESGKVTEVLQKGYKLNGKVIRSSMVKVNN